MKATIETTGEIITGKNIQEIRSKLNSMLSVDGPRGLTAVTENGTGIHVELYEGQDWTQRNWGGSRPGSGRKPELTPREKAERRVEKSAQLQQHRDLILDYDWKEGDDHYRWVATASVAEILDWAETIQ